MALSKPTDPLFDPIRKKWVAASPEERVRQKLLNRMIKDLGYPKEYIAVEVALSQLPHLSLRSSDEVPSRRVDILVFAKGIDPDHELYPLLMVECKAAPLTHRFAQQVVGYNESVGAPFLALANGEEVLTGFWDEILGHYEFRPGLPGFSELRASGGEAHSPFAPFAYTESPQEPS